MTFIELQTQLKPVLDRHLAEHLDLLRQMVDINSFTANPQGIFRMGRLTAGAFGTLGFQAEFIQAANPLYGEHLILTRPGHGRYGRTPPTIALTAHLDTVYPEAEELENDFHWREAGARIYGPGTFDIKGGIVMIRLMLTALRAARPDLYDSVNWVILLNAAEEALVPDFGQISRQRLAAPDTLANLVFEGGRADLRRNAYRVVVARKGMARYRLEVNGRAAHAGTAHAQGASAILQLADVIQQVADYTDYGNQITFNVGTIMGGTVLNRVPHNASAFVEMRAFSPDVFYDGLRKMEALAAYSTVYSPEDGYGCQVDVELLGEWQPWARNAATDELLAVWRKAGATLGMSVTAEERGGLSDGNWTWQQVPTIDGLGPAGGNAHCSERSADGSKDQEYVLASTFVPQGLLNLTALLHLIENY